MTHILVPEIKEYRCKHLLHLSAYSTEQPNFYQLAFIIVGYKQFSILVLFFNASNQTSRDHIISIRASVPSGFNNQKLIDPNQSFNRVAFRILDVHQLRES